MDRTTARWTFCELGSVDGKRLLTTRTATTLGCDLLATRSLKEREEDRLVCFSKFPRAEENGNLEARGTTYTSARLENVDVTRLPTANAATVC